MRPVWMLAGIILAAATAVSASAADPAMAKIVVHDLTIVENGKAHAVLVVPDGAHDDERLAAREIQEHVQRMSGVELPVLDLGAARRLELGTPTIYVGRAADAELEDLIRRKGDDPASFALVVDGNSASLRGLSPEGTLFAAYELLEQLGVRWFLPGELGTVIPQSKTVVLAEQQTVQVPSFHARWHDGRGKDGWHRRVRMGGPRFPSSHGIDLAAGGSFEEHPEYYALIDGERKPTQLCVSNAEVVKLTVQATKHYFRERPGTPWIGMGPDDWGGFCECENCKALDAGDWQPFFNCVSMTDRYIWFFNQVLKGIEDEFPDKKVCFYAYWQYVRPPVKVKADPRIVPAFAPITLCSYHGLGNPICPEKNNYYRWLIQEWGKILPEVYERGYWYNLWDIGLPFSMVHRLRTQIPVCHELGITGWRVETLDHWASETPSLYVAARLMWDHTADVDAMLGDFYEKFFGPAAMPMGRYFTMMDATLRDGDYHTGGCWPLPHFYPAPLRRDARALLDEAQKLAGDGVHGERVKLFRLSFDYLEAFLDMMRLRNAYDWPGAKAALDRVDALREELLSYDPPMLHPRWADGWLAHFYRHGTVEGYERATGGNRVVATLPDEWDFQLDPQGVGEALEFYRTELKGGNWGTIKTLSAFWGDQGLRYYMGDAWYRQKVHIPGDCKGRRVLVWFGSVNGTPKVWVNGKPIRTGPASAYELDSSGAVVPVGTALGNAYEPFELDATEAIVPGDENLLVVRVRRDRVQALGAGGIMGPVMFYVPAAPQGPAP